MPEVRFSGSTYSPVTGLIYIFNLIVGTGALAMPSAFNNAGWLLSLIIVVTLAVMSYLTTTFVIESMASANAMIHWRMLQKLKKVNSLDDLIGNDMKKVLRPKELRTISSIVAEGNLRDEDIARSIDGSEKTPLMNNALDRVSDSPRTEYYDITEQTEMGMMAKLFFNKIGLILFYISIIIYLYGDLAIYATAISKSLRDVTCNFANNASNLSESQQCLTSNSSLSRMNMYRIYVALLTLALGPFVFFNLQKTKYLQIATTIMRWIAFILMIVLVSIRLGKGEGKGHPSIANIEKVPNLFGVCVYSFMCHHSLPSMVTPINKKEKLFGLIAGDYILILMFYCLLSFTGIFAFDKIDDLYTLNFQPNIGNTSDPVTNIAVIQYFLALFPVFTLSSNFPIIGITLRNNLKSLFKREKRPFPWFIDRIVFPLAAILPPIVISLGTNSIGFLVGITGSYAGSIIQYLVPAALVFYSRKETNLALGLGVKNKHASPFKHVGWIIFVLVWAAACLIFVTYDHIDSGF